MKERNVTQQDINLPVHIDRFTDEYATRILRVMYGEADATHPKHDAVRYVLRLYAHVMPEELFVNMLMSIPAMPSFNVFLSDGERQRWLDAGLINKDTVASNFPVRQTIWKRDPIGWDRLSRQAELANKRGEIVFSQSRASALPFWLVNIAYARGDMTIGKHLRIMDLCACPGNKSFNMMHIPGVEDVTVMMNDIKAHRMRRTTQRLSEFGFCKQGDMYFKELRNGTMVKVIPTSVDASDKDGVARSAEYAFGDESPQIVIADVPCPGDGQLFTRAKTTLYGIQPRSIEDTILQQKILNNALDLVTADGAVCYSTCSVNPIMNEGVIEAVKMGRGGLEFVDLPLDDETYLFPLVGEFPRRSWDLKEQIQGLRTYPHTMDIGFFASLVRRGK